MALERLRESIRGRNVTVLRNSIKDCQDYGMQDHKEVKNASNIVTVFDARRSTLYYYTLLHTPTARLCLIVR